MKDGFQRSIDYMRISITDRCNLRCRYCMPEEGIRKIPMSGILTYEEILLVCRLAVKLGITDFRVTGGEPLVRLGCADLIRRMKEIPGLRKAALTTNGQLLGDHLEDLVRAGLDGVNVSLDSLKEDRYQMITRGGELRPVLDSIRRAQEAGLPVKVNCLLQKGLNEDELGDFAAFAFDRGIDVRFIELMPVGYGDPAAGVSGETALRLLREQIPRLLPDDRDHGSGPAVYYRIPGRSGAVGFIDAVNGGFCGRCNRIRLTSAGLLRPCLGHEMTVDLKPALRAGSEEEVTEILRKAIESKPSGHCFGAARGEAETAMSEIGG